MLTGWRAPADGETRRDRANGSPALTKRFMVTIPTRASTSRTEGADRRRMDLRSSRTRPSGASSLAASGQAPSTRCTGHAIGGGGKRTIGRGSSVRNVAEFLEGDVVLLAPTAHAARKVRDVAGVRPGQHIARHV